MSSRLIRSNETAAVSAVSWRQTGAAHPNGIFTEPVGNAAGDREQELEGRIKQAYQQGYNEAEGAAAQRAAQALNPVLSSLTKVVQELALTGPRFRTEAESDTVKLAIAIARRLLHRELSTDPEAILGLVLAAFQKLNARETHRLRLCALDAALVQDNRARLELPQSLEIAADPSLPPGSAIFETSRGELDASIQAQLGEIERGFTDVLRQRTK